MKNNKKGFVDLGFAKLDIQREKRRGFPEIIYAHGKSHRQLIKIIKCLYMKEEIDSTKLKQ